MGKKKENNNITENHTKLECKNIVASGSQNGKSLGRLCNNSGCPIAYGSAVAHA